MYDAIAIKLQRFWVVMPLMPASITQIFQLGTLKVGIELNPAFDYPAKYCCCSDMHHFMCLAWLPHGA
jgi:hypothetical protein